MKLKKILVALFISDGISSKITAYQFVFVKKGKAGCLFRLRQDL
jgi:hypothetical protein